MSVLTTDTLEIAFYGRVGSDTAGEVLVKELQRANVDISGVRRVAGGSGAFADLCLADVNYCFSLCSYVNQC